MAAAFRSFWTLISGARYLEGLGSGCAHGSWRNFCGSLESWPPAVYPVPGFPEVLKDSYLWH